MFCPACLPGCLQGQLLLVAMEFMPGGNLRVALQQPEMRQQLRWEARWVGSCACSGSPCPRSAYMCAVAVTDVATTRQHTRRRANHTASCICCCRGRQVALDIAEALDYLHNEPKVLHGDLKPG